MYELITYGSMAICVIFIIYIIYAAATGKLKKENNHAKSHYCTYYNSGFL